MGSQGEGNEGIEQASSGDLDKLLAVVEPKTTIEQPLQRNGIKQAVWQVLFGRDPQFDAVFRPQSRRAGFWVGHPDVQQVLRVDFNVGSQKCEVPTPRRFRVVRLGAVTVFSQRTEQQTTATLVLLRCMRVDAATYNEPGYLFVSSESHWLVAVAWKHLC